MKQTERETQSSRFSKEFSKKLKSPHTLDRATVPHEKWGGQSGGLQRGAGNLRRGEIGGFRREKGLKVLKNPYWRKKPHYRRGELKKKRNIPKAVGKTDGAGQPHKGGKK